MKNNLPNIRTYKKGNDIVIDKNDFETILLCLCSQKFIGESPQNGDSLSIGQEAYEKSQNEMQDFIDGWYHGGMQILGNNHPLSKLRMWINKHRMVHNFFRRLNLI